MSKEQDFVVLSARAAAANIKIEKYYYGDNNEYFGLNVALPCGKGIRTLHRPSDELGQLLGINFEGCRFVEDYWATFDVGVGRVEAALDHVAALYAFSDDLHVWELPGVKWAPGSPIRPPDRRQRETPEGWALTVSNGETSVELSPRTKEFVALHGRYSHFGEVTLKVWHKLGPKGPRAKDLLDGPARDFLLDLDIMYHVGVHLLHHGERRAPMMRTASKSAVRFPQYAYAPEAHALYWYAVAASGFPLLQFLAYYQILEFHFSRFSRATVIGRVRSQLKSPLFDPSSDLSLSRLIDATADAHRGITGEREQLRVTINACIEEEDLKSLISESEVLKDHFCGKVQPIKGALLSV